MKLKHDYIMASVDAHALTAAAKGKGVYRAELPDFESVYPEFAKERPAQ